MIKKLTGENASPGYLYKIQSCRFSQSKHLDDLLQQVELMYITAFAHGNRNVGMNQLRRITRRKVV